MDYEKQTEDFRGEWDRLVMGGKEGMYCMVHWYYMEVMNHVTLHQKLGMYNTQFVSHSPYSLMFHSLF